MVHVATFKLYSHWNKNNEATKESGKCKKRTKNKNRSDAHKVFRIKSTGTLVVQVDNLQQKHF